MVLCSFIVLYENKQEKKEQTMTVIVGDEAARLNAINNGDQVSVLHEGKIRWWHRLTERFTVLGSLHRINHRAWNSVHNKLRTIRFLKSNDVKLGIAFLIGLMFCIIILIPYCLLWGESIIKPAAAMGGIGIAFFSFFIVLVSFMLFNLDNLTSSLAIPDGLIMATTMNDQPFLIAIRANLDDARMIYKYDRGRLKAKYTRHSRIVQSGDLSGSVVYSPGEISDENMMRLIPRMERAVRRYIAERCNTARDGEKLEASLAPSDTLDGFDESISTLDERRSVMSMDAALSTRLWVMLNSYQKLILPLRGLTR